MKPPVETTLRDGYPEIFRFIDRGECGIGYSPKVREFGLQVRASNSSVRQAIHYCPFTGKALPSGLRDEFFDALEAIGLDGGLSDVENAPPEFQSEAWWIARGL